MCYSIDDLRPIDEKSSQIFVKIISILGDNRHLKLNRNPIFMPLVIDDIPEIEIDGVSFCQTSLTHYGKSNGDLMRDPEMIFIYDRKIPDKIYPYYYRNDWAGVEAFGFHLSGNKIDYLDKTVLSCIVEMAETFLKNIDYQQLSSGELDGDNE